MNITSMGEIRDFEKETETPQGYSITPNITAGGITLEQLEQLFLLYHFYIIILIENLMI